MRKHRTPILAVNGIGRFWQFVAIEIDRHNYSHLPRCSLKFAVILVLHLALIALVPLASAADSASLAGHWEGFIEKQKAKLAIRVDIRDSSANPAVLLDIPSLVYAWEPLPMKLEGTGVTANFPFEIGEIPLKAENPDLLKGQTKEFTVELRRSPAFQFRQFEVTIPVEGTTLPGTLYEPPSATHAPAVVIAGGSGATRTGWTTRSWCDFFMRQGLACLVYDRRPEITADGKPTAMATDSDDLISAVRFLEGRSEIDSVRTGIFAHSRGVWLAVRGAAHSDIVHFMVLVGAPATTPEQQEVDFVVGLMREEGRTESEMSEAMDYYRLYFHVAHSGRDWDKLRESVQSALHAKWGGYVDQPRALADLAWWGANGDFDNGGDLPLLKIPVYVFWGSADKVTPPLTHEPLLKEHLAHSHASSVTTRIFPGGDHRGEIKPGTDAQGNFHWFGMAPGLIDALTEWIRTRVFVTALGS